MAGLAHVLPALQPHPAPAPGLNPPSLAPAWVKSFTSRQQQQHSGSSCRPNAPNCGGWSLKTRTGSSSSSSSNNSTCSSRSSSKHDGSAVASTAAGSAFGVAATRPGGRGGSRGSWSCRTVGPPVRRPPPLLLQVLGAESAVSEDAAGGDYDDVDEGASQSEEGEEGELLPGVFRVQCVQDLPRFDLPLLLGSFRSSTCNAIAVSYGEESYILAPAASVVYGSQIRILLPGRDKPFTARLLHLGLECELAVLGVNSPEFWEAVVPYNLASYGLPHLQQQVAVVSYEDGQPRPRSAPATVMRTEVVTYPSAMQRLLGMTVAVGLSKEQIGSAVVDSRGILLGLVFARTASSSGANKNARGSGDGGGRGGGGERWGHGRRRVGRRASRRGQTEASATAVPAAVVARFLEDIQRHGSYQGFPTLGIQWKRTESAALRRFTGMSAEQTGVVITSLNPTAALAALAQPLDVLAAVGGAAVGNDGTVEFRNGADSIHISYHVSQFRVGDDVDLTIIRGGQLVTASITLGVPHRLLPLHLAGRPPQYAVVSGLVLTVLSAPFLEGAFGRSWAVRAPAQLLREWHNHPSRADEQVVVVAECQDMGPGSATDGYERRAVMYQRVVRCNGTHVVNMRHLVTLLADAMVAAATGGGGGARRINGRRHGGAAALQTSAAAPTEVATNANDEDSEGGRLVSELSDPAVVSAITAYDKDESDANHNDDGGGKGPPYDPENLVLELSNRMVLVLPLRRALEDTRAMLEEFEVQHAVSEDLRPLYDGGLRGLGRGGGAGSKAVVAAGAGSRGRSSGGGGGRTRASLEATSTSEP